MMNPTTKVIVSKLFSLSSRDWLRALATAMIYAALMVIRKATDIYHIDWPAVLNDAVNAGVAYLLLNLGTGKQIIVNNPPTSAMNAVDAGAVIHVDGQPIAAKTPTASDTNQIK